MQKIPWPWNDYRSLFRAKRTAPILDGIHCSHIPGGTIIQECVWITFWSKEESFSLFDEFSYQGKLPLGHTENIQ